MLAFDRSSEFISLNLESGSVRPYESIVDLFEAAVKDQAEAIALICNDRTITYREVDSRANKVANFLRDKGIDADALVCVCMERSIEMVITLLGILKAGGAYLALDPGYPTERLDYMIEDAAPIFVLVEEKTEARVRPRNGVTIVVDDIQDAINAFSGEKPSTKIPSDSLAYVIYTSGSSGKPKGVEIEHHSLTNFVLSMKSSLEMSSTDVVMASTSMAFDISGLEIFLPLVSGASVVIATEGDSRDPVVMTELIGHHDVTVVQATPSSWRLLREVYSGERRLRLALCGGEAIDSGIAAFLCQIAELAWNLYGPTETTIWSTQTKINVSIGSNIGFPINNTRVYLLNQYFAPVQPGEIGEIYIAGAGVARGYRNKPELTSEKFLVGLIPGETSRLYRTGDLGRFRNDQGIDYLGRSDFQVKFRGHRIELEEIENTLLEYSEISGAVVVVSVFDENDIRLLAYITTNRNISIDVTTVRIHLLEKLPAYMVPGSVIQLDEFPLTLNNKVDRKLLSARALNIPAKNASAGTKEGGVARALLGIWQDILKIEEIKLTDDFFHLGGHSLLALRVINRIEDALNVRIKVKDFFLNSTFNELVSIIENTQPKLADKNQGLKERRKVGEFNISYTQEKLLRFDNLNPSSFANNLFYVYKIKGSLNYDFLRKSLTELTVLHSGLRSRIVDIDGKRKQYVDEQWNGKLEIRIVESPSSFEQVLGFEQKRPFFLSEEHPFRAVLIVVPGGETILAFTVHHAFFDGASQLHMMKDILAIYSSLENGLVPSIARLGFNEFSEFERGKYDSYTGKEEDLKYWQGKLVPFLPMLSWGDFSSQGYKSATQPFKIDHSLGSDIEVAASRLKVTSFSILLSSFSQVVAAFAKQSEFLIAIPFLRRQITEFESSLGPFADTQIFKAAVGHQVPHKALIAATYSQLIDMLDNQEIPYPKLMALLQPGLGMDYVQPANVRFVMAPKKEVTFSTSTITMDEIPISELSPTTRDITIYLDYLESNEISGVVQYNELKFKASTIAAFIDDFLLMLDKSVQNS